MLDLVSIKPTPQMPDAMPLVSDGWREQEVRTCHVSHISNCCILFMKTASLDRKEDHIPDDRETDDDIPDGAKVLASQTPDPRREQPNQIDGQLIASPIFIQ